MKTKTKTFPLNVVLTVTTQRLLTTHRGDRDNGIGDLYEILNWMTNDNLFTHQLLRACAECKPWLLRWFPELGAVSIPSLDKWLEADKTERKTECAALWMTEQKILIPALKTEYEIPRIPRDDHDHIHPVKELVDMVGPEKVLVVSEGDR